VHSRDSEVAGGKLVGKPVNLPTGVAEDDGLGDSDGLVQVGEGVKLPVLLLNSNVELLDTFKGEFILLDKDTNGVAHELGGDLKHVLGHGSREQDDLSGLGEQLEDVVDLLSETARQHLISFVEDEHLHVVGLKNATLNHVLDTTGSADDDVGSLLKSLHVIANAGPTNAGMAFNVHEITNGDDNLLDLLGQLTSRGEDEGLAGLDVGIKLLEDRDGEGSRFTGTRLGLRNHIVACRLRQLPSHRSRQTYWETLTLDNGHDGALLDGGGALETVGVDSTKELCLEIHRIERVGGLVVVGLNLAYRRGRLAQGEPKVFAQVAGVARQARGALTLGHILETFVSHDCGFGNRGLQALRCSRGVARGGAVGGGDPLDTAAGEC